MKLAVSAANIVILSICLMLNSTSGTYTQYVGEKLDHAACDAGEKLSATGQAVQAKAVSSSAWVVNTLTEYFRRQDYARFYTLFHEELEKDASFLSDEIRSMYNTVVNLRISPALSKSHDALDDVALRMKHAAEVVASKSKPKLEQFVDTIKTEAPRIANSAKDFVVSNGARVPGLIDGAVDSTEAAVKEHGPAVVAGAKNVIGKVGGFLGW